MSSTRDAQLCDVLISVGSDLCLALQIIEVSPNSNWDETGYRERGVSDPQVRAPASRRQDAGPFPCRAVTSSCEAVARIASVFIGKLFQAVIHTASTSSLKLVGDPTNI